MKYNYDTVALFYDRLARLAYGNAQTDAQLFLLRHIPPGAHILIAGGGTGWILEEIAKIYPSGLIIDYVDVSAKMISRSQKRNVAGNKITFINDGVENITYAEGYDIVLTPFLFDNFTEATAQKIFSVIGKLLKPAGLWLYCDFQNTGKLWHRFLLKSMYLFFGILCGVEATKLSDAAALFSDNGYTTITEQAYMNGFIISTVYKRMT